MVEVKPINFILNKIFHICLDKVMSYNNEEKFNNIAKLVFLITEADKKNKIYFLKKADIVKELIAKIYYLCQVDKELDK
ncbi:hypothetical protein ONB78_00405 [Candidatus Karelsulcia muelleri]|nr:hypothetical protein [Candidatus Karelsulcia muelleri]WDE42272.1 hypothetical protein ONB78_00405 [Candidatus Karelsulcia muelleri]WDR79121.1 hypothetical protein ONB77_00190 [Candidatus Karelsulcia muelleri]